MYFPTVKEWHVEGIERAEAEMPEYVRKKKLRNLKLKDKSNFVKWCWTWEPYAKLFISFLILFFMVNKVFLIKILSLKINIKFYLFNTFSVSSKLSEHRINSLLSRLHKNKGLPK